MIVRILIAVLLGIIGFLVANIFLPHLVSVLIGFVVGLLYFYGV